MNIKTTLLLVFLVFFIGLTTSIVSQNLEDGLIGYWSLNEGTDTITADISDNGKDGIINTDSNWVEGKFGSALKFNENDYVNLGNDEWFELGTSDFTISAWIRTPGPSLTDYATIFAKGGDNGLGIRYHLVIEDSAMRIIIDDEVPFGKKDPLGGIKVCDNEWHLIVGYRDGGTLRVYVDGQEDEELSGKDRATFDPSISIAGCVHGAYIGAITDNSDPTFKLIKFFNGVMDDVALWDRTLTLSEIDYLWNNGDGNPVIEVVPSAVADLQQNEFGLLENYPNPFNSLTTFSFELPENSDTKLTVYNSLGQEVAVLVDGMRLAGIHKAQFDGSELPDGVYFAKFHTGLYSKTIKMLLTK